MIGRGTRLSKDLFGPGDDKTCFNVFDYCENFEFFDHHPDGISQGTITPISQRIYNIKLDIAYFFCRLPELEEFQKAYRDKLLDTAHTAIVGLDDETFRVRKNLRAVELYKDRAKWNSLNADDVKLIQKELSPLIVDTEDDEFAKRFDLLTLNLQFAVLNNDLIQGSYIDRIKNIASGLLEKTTIPSVAGKIEYIKAITKDEFWTSISIQEIEKVREELRELIKFLDKQKRNTIYTSFKDHFSAEEKIWDLVPASTKMESYKRRVERFIHENESHITIHKLKNNIPITRTDIQALEDIMFSEDKLGNKKQFEEMYGPQPLGVFIRSLIGMDTGAAKIAFNEFLAAGNLSADQIRFIDTIINYLSEKGIIEKERLYEPPFTELNELGVDGIFNNSERENVFSILEEIKKRALVG
jgi:type I restriction enzyme R subunit